VDRLMNENLTILIVDLKKNSPITVGVPHHTPAGNPFMPTMDKRPGDENAGFIGRFLAEKLKASFVCACNYFLDPNKNLDTDYSQAIIRSKPKVLVEIHGHGSHNTDNDVEISCGSRKDEKYAIGLMIELKNKLRGEDIPSGLKNLKIEGRYDQIYFRATRAATIKKPAWIAYHIEIPQFLRVSPETMAVPEEGKVFAKALGKALLKIYQFNLFGSN